MQTSNSHLLEALLMARQKVTLLNKSPMESLGRKTPQILKNTLHCHIFNMRKSFAKIAAPQLVRSNEKKQK